MLEDTRQILRICYALRTKVSPAYPYNEHKTAVKKKFYDYAYGIFLVFGSLKKPYAGLPEIIFLISQPKHMLWVLKRTVSMRRFFQAPKTCLNWWVRK